MAQVDNELRILQVLEHRPDTTQASLAAQLGVAVGSVNRYHRRLIRRGYVEATQMERRRLKYFVTPQGLEHKASLASQYLDDSLRVYRELRSAANDALAEVRAAEYQAIVLDGEGEALDIMRLTCIGQAVAVLPVDTQPLPCVRSDGVGYAIEWARPAGHENRDV